MGLGFQVIARLKFLRGTALEPFGHSEEPRTERALVTERIERELAHLSGGTLEHALQVARVPERIRGFGQIKEENIRVARAEWEQLDHRVERGALAA